MTAEFDTEPGYANEDDQDPQPARDERDDRGVWGTLALIALAAVVLFVLLTQFTAQVPQTVGLTRADAEAKLTQAGFAVGDVSEVAPAAQKPGLVQEQAPVAGSTVRKGSTVDLMVVLGGNLTAVPNVCGRDSANASVAILQAGFAIADSEQYSDSVPQGVAAAQSPAAGALAKNGSTVTVFYSLGPQSDASVAVSHSDTSDGMTDADRSSTGSGAAPLIMTLSRAYPGASTWSSGGDIFLRLTPGGAARRVTRTSDWDTDPVISPSHRYLVFRRAAGPGSRARSLGAVSFTTFSTHILALPETSQSAHDTYSYGRPVFAPTAGATTPNSDWIVFAQYWPEHYLGQGTQLSARLLVCNVPMGSAWVAWNERLRPALSLTLGRSGRAGCVRVTQKSGSKTTYARDFNATTGLFLR